MVTNIHEVCLLNHKVETVIKLNTILMSILFKGHFYLENHASIGR
jgi:hypothetical protein